MREILDYLNDCEVLKKDAFLWTWHYRLSSVAFDLAPFAQLFTEFTFPLYSAEGIFAQPLLSPLAAVPYRPSTRLAPNRNMQCDNNTLVFRVKQLGLLLQRQDYLDSVLPLCPCAPYEGVSESGSIAPLIRNLGCRWGSVASLSSRLLYTPDLA
jgi:hypothetical protein